MTRAEVISKVNKKTENSLVGQVDFQSLFLEIEQEFCAEHRYWWRHKRFTFSTVSGADTYDLSDTSAVTTTPANVGPFVEEITFVGRENGTKMDELDPIFDDSAIAEWGLDSAQDKPTVYTIESNTPTNAQTLRVHRKPNGIYTLHVFAWMMPQAVSDSSDETIYIIPPVWHHALQTGLEREVWRLKYGQQDPKFITANALYEKKVAAAKVQPAFSTKKTVQFRRNDGRAIRSTR